MFSFSWSCLGFNGILKYFIESVQAVEVMEDKIVCLIFDLDGVDISTVSPLANCIVQVKKISY